MKTTVELSASLLRRARQAALERNTTLRAIIEEALARALGPAAAPEQSVRTITWPPPDAKARARVTTDDVLAAVARARAVPLDDPARLARRLGFVPSPAGPRAPRRK